MIKSVLIICMVAVVLGLPDMSKLDAQDDKETEKGETLVGAQQYYGYLGYGGYGGYDYGNNGYGYGNNGYGYGNYGGYGGYGHGHRHRHGHGHGHGSWGDSSGSHG